VLLYEAFGWADTMPAFVHLPLLLKPDGKGKLSKRDGDRLGFPVFPLEWHDPKTGAISTGYRESGYLPEAVVNFLALLGWNPGDDTEVMTMQELISKFSFEHCSRSGAKFAFEKGKWFNHTYLQNISDAELAQLFKPVMQQNGVNPADFSDEYIAKAVSLVKSRINFVSDLWEQARFFFVAPESYDAKAVKKRWSAEMPELMNQLIEVLENLPDFASQAAEPVVLNWITENGYHMGNVMNAFRLTVVGECKGPHMFDITELIGRDETIKRIKAGVERISNEPAV
jgi:glutamyl-tRNA synthetase